MTGDYLVATPIWKTKIANTVADESGEILGSITQVLICPDFPSTHIKIILSDGSKISAPKDFLIPIVRLA